MKALVITLACLAVAQAHAVKRPTRAWANATRHHDLPEKGSGVVRTPGKPSPLPPFIFDDGAREVRLADGGARTVRADGARVTWSADRAGQWSSSDGQSYRPDGRGGWTSTGRRYTARPDGGFEVRENRTSRRVAMSADAQTVRASGRLYVRRGNNWSVRDP